MKKSTKYISLALAGMLTLGALTGCGKSSTQADSAKETASKVDVLVQYNDKPEEKVFDVGEHTITVPALVGIAYRKASLQYEPVDGYRVVSTSVSAKYGYDTYYYVTYQNTEPVTVSPVWNPVLDCYDYTQFGEVLSYDYEEESNYSLTK